MYSDLILGTAPVAYWPLQETDDSDPAYDLSGNNLSGTLDAVATGGLLLGQPGPASVDDDAYAIQFDGVSGYIEVPDDPLLDIAGSITIMAWVYMTAYPALYSPLVVKGPTAAGASNPGNYEFGVESGHHTRFRFEQPSNTINTFTSTGTVGLAGWHHLAVVFTSASTVVFYIDGIAAGSTATAKVGGAVNTNTLLIGNRQDSRFFAGSIAHVAIWPSALTAGQIRALYLAAGPVNATTGLIGTLGLATTTLGRTLTGTFSLQTKKQLQGTLSLETAQKLGSYRGDMTTVDRDALTPKFVGDVVNNLDTQFQEMWNGSTWAQGKRIYVQSSQIQQPVLSSGPTSGPFYVDINADNVYIFRLWDGNPAHYKVTMDTAGNAMYAGSLSAGSLDIPAAGVVGFHVDTAGNLGIGGTTATTGPFRVTAAGALTASSGTIGGWTLGATTLTGGTMVLDATAGTLATASTAPRILINDPGSVGTGDTVQSRQIISFYTGAAAETQAGYSPKIYSYSPGGQNTWGIVVKGPSSATIGAGMVIIGQAGSVQVLVDSGAGTATSTSRMLADSTGTRFYGKTYPNAASGTQLGDSTHTWDLYAGLVTTTGQAAVGGYAGAHASATGLGVAGQSEFSSGLWIGGYAGTRAIATTGLGVAGASEFTGTLFLTPASGAALSVYLGALNVLYFDASGYMRHFSETGGAGHITIQNTTDTTTGGNIQIRKARGTTAAPTAVWYSDLLGDYRWLGWSNEGTPAFRTAAYIQARVDTTGHTTGTVVAANAWIPGRLEFVTTDDTGASAARLYIYGSGGGYWGSGPSDPGTNNFTVKGVLAAGSGVVGGYNGTHADVAIGLGVKGQSEFQNTLWLTPTGSNDVLTAAIAGDQNFTVNSIGQLILRGTGSARSSQFNITYFDDAFGVNVHLRKGRGTLAAPTPAYWGDQMGLVNYAGLSNEATPTMRIGAVVRGIIDDTGQVNGTLLPSGQAYVPGRLEFVTTSPTGTSTVRMTIYSSGGVYVGGSPSDPGTGNLTVVGTLVVGSASFGTPVATGTANAAGSAGTFARSDHVHATGVITTKGDILTWSTLPARLAVGADNTILMAASGQATGLKWQAAGTSPGTVVASAPSGGTAGTWAQDAHQHAMGIVTTKGDLLGYTTTPARVAVGRDGQQLQSDSANAAGISWGDEAKTSTVAQVSVAATVTDTNLGTYAAAAPQAGTTYRVSVTGNMTAVSSATARNFLIKIKWGTVVLLTITTIVPTGTAKTSAYFCEILVTIRSTTTAIAGGICDTVLPASTGTAIAQMGTVQTITTGAQTLAATAAMSVVVAGDTITAEQVTIEMLKA